jgi:hypothetical protein
MRVIFTIDEMYTIDGMAATVCARLSTVHPAFKKPGTKGAMTHIREFIAANPDQEVVRVDEAQRLVIITIPEETTFAVVGAVEALYMELLEIVPVIISVIRMLKRTNERYVAAIEHIAKKLSAK